MNKFDGMLATFKEGQEKILKDRRAASKQSTNTTEKVLILGLMLVIATSLFISYLIARAIANTVGQAVDLAEAISKGDLTRSLTKKGEDEVGRLVQALNAMVEFLREQTRRTIEGVNVLGSSAAEIAATVSQLGASTFTNVLSGYGNHYDYRRSEAGRKNIKRHGEKGCRKCQTSGGDIGSRQKGHGRYSPSHESHKRAD